MSILRFDWDEENIRHLARHEIASAEAEQIILNRRLISNRIFAMAKSAWRKWEKRTGGEFSS